jgi:hypothetical protein
MKRIICFLFVFVLLNGCAEYMAAIGSGAIDGKILQSSVNSAVSYGVKKKTGKTPLKHDLSYAEEQREKKKISENKIQPCVEFLEPIDANLCKVIKARIQILSKVKNLN